MSEVSTPINVVAGGTAVGVSVSSSVGKAESFYRATWDQIVTMNFNVVVSDVLGLLSVGILCVNLYFTIKREFKKRKDSPEN